MAETTELYKRYRPKTLERIVGNEQTVASLRNMLERKTLPRTILFHGPSGCGKTTFARILKTELGCHDMDFKEINSSSFRGIDTIRDIQRVMNLAPAAGPCRVFLLDEFHKATNDAQNAALKMLEDTPSHCYFFICTTDPQKLIKAVLTRCCEMPVRLLTEKEQGSLLERVMKKESITLSDATRDALIDAAAGSARTLLVLLDKIANLKEEEQEAAIQAKLAEENEAIDLCRALMKKESWKRICGILSNLKSEAEATRWAVLGYARVCLLKTQDWQAYNVIKSFENNFYDSKDAGLVAACYEALNAKE